MPTNPGHATEDRPRSTRRARSPRGQGDTLRDDIVAAAGRILSATGDIGDLSLRGVAREVGVATTSLYRHFANLAELVLAVRLAYLDEFTAAIDAAADAAASPRERQRAIARAYVDWGLANPGRYAALFSNLNLPPELVPDMVTAGVAAIDAIRRINAEAVPDESDVDLLTVHLWTALHGIVTLRTVRYGFPWPDLAEELDDLIARLSGRS